MYLQICAKTLLLPRISEYAPDERIEDIFCVRRKPANFCHLALPTNQPAWLGGREAIASQRRRRSWAFKAVQLAATVWPQKDLIRAESWLRRGCHTECHPRPKTTPAWHVPQLSVCANRSHPGTLPISTPLWLKLP